MFANSIRPYTSTFTMAERAAFFEWYFRNRGFNIGFAYFDDFDHSGKSHLRLLVTNRLGEVMSLEPSYAEMKADSISPRAPKYVHYSKQF
jgi:hypothetical protein